MNPCRRYEPWIKAALAGTLPDDEGDRLREHARSCPGCGAVLDLHNSLERQGRSDHSPRSMPTAEEFQAMRRAVRRRVASPAAGKRARPPLIRDLAALFRAHPSMAAGTAVAIMAGLFLLGRWSAPAPDAGSAGLLREIEANARRQQDLAATWEAPYIYSNVSLRPEGDGRLALSFDITRHFSLVTEEDSPIAREAMVHAILDASTIAPRLKAISLAARVTDDRIKEALILALANDPNQAVRLKALAALEQVPFDSEVESALLRSLRDDEAVQVRLQAIEFLTDRKIDPETIHRAIEEGDRPVDAVTRRADALRGRM